MSEWVDIYRERKTVVAGYPVNMKFGTRVNCTVVSSGKEWHQFSVVFSVYSLGH